MHDRDTTPWRRDPWHLLAFRHHALVQHWQRGAIHPLVLVLLLRYGMYWLVRQHRRSYGVGSC